MGIKLMVEILDHWQDAGLTVGERDDLLVLAENANDGTRLTWGPVHAPYILRRANKSAASWKNSIGKLVKKGVLAHQSGGHRGRSAVYRLVPVCPHGSHDGWQGMCRRPEKGHLTDDPIDAKGHPTDDPTDELGHLADDSIPEASDAKGHLSGDPTGELGHPTDDPIDGKGHLTGDPYPSLTTPSASKQEQPAAERHGYGIPDAARPLVDGLTAAGVIVRWPFTGNAWFPLLALIEKSGVPALVDHAVRTAARTDVDSAKYFMSGWRELPPLPGPGTPSSVPRSRPRARPSNRHANPDDQSAYDRSI